MISWPVSVHWVSVVWVYIHIFIRVMHGVNGLKKKSSIKSVYYCIWRFWIPHSQIKFSVKATRPEQMEDLGKYWWKHGFVLSIFLAAFSQFSFPSYTDEKKPSGGNVNILFMSLIDYVIVNICNFQTFVINIKIIKTKIISCNIVLSAMIRHQEIT